MNNRKGIQTEKKKEKLTQDDELSTLLLPLKDRNNRYEEHGLVLDRVCRSGIIDRENLRLEILRDALGKVDNLGDEGSRAEHGVIVQRCTCTLVRAIDRESCFPHSGNQSERNR